MLNTWEPGCSANRLLKTARYTAGRAALYLAIRHAGSRSWPFGILSGSASGTSPARTSDPSLTSHFDQGNSLASAEDDLIWNHESRYVCALPREASGPPQTV